MDTMIEPHVLSQAGAILNSSDILSWNKITEKEWDGKGRPTVRIRVKIYAAMVLDHPGDLVALMRKVRNSIPTQYPVEFNVKTVL